MSPLIKWEEERRDKIWGVNPPYNVNLEFAGSWGLLPPPLPDSETKYLFQYLCTSLSLVATLWNLSHFDGFKTDGDNRGFHSVHFPHYTRGWGQKKDLLILTEENKLLKNENSLEHHFRKPSNFELEKKMSSNGRWVFHVRPNFLLAVLGT